MAEIAPSAVLDQLQLALAEPEPMCLAVIQVDPVETSSGVQRSAADPELVDQVQERMRDTLRRYDELVELDSHAMALIMRTLADATVLADRMRTFFNVAAESYLIDGSVWEVKVLLGAAIRQPQDTPELLLARVDEALKSAEAAGAVGPVVI